MLSLLREGRRHRPGGAWLVLIRAGSVAAALYVLWIGALANVTGGLALDAARVVHSELLEDFGTWARAFTAQFHLDISIFIAITFPIAFLTTTAGPKRSTLAWTDVALAALSFVVAMYYIVFNDYFLNWSRGFSQPTVGDVLAGFTLLVLVVELCRRSVGWGLTSLVVLLLVFTFFGHWMPGALRHDNFGVPYFIEMMTITENGIFGAPLEVAATYAFLFVLFGSFYALAEALSDASTQFAFPETPCGEIADLMVESGVGRVPIVDPESRRVVGIISRQDLLKVRSRHTRVEKARSRGAVIDTPR